MKQFLLGCVVATVIFVIILSSIDIPEYLVVYQAMCV